MPMTIRCNNVPRDTLYWHELMPREQCEFAYLDTDEKRSEASFVRYKGHVYDLGEFMRIDRAIAPHCDRPQWETFDGYLSDSFFSGVLVRYVDDFERVILATYLS